MKKNTISLMAVLGFAMTIASCNSELTEDNTSTTKTYTEKEQTIFTATHEDADAPTRTVVDGTNVCWQNGDAVAVWDGTEVNAFTATPGSDKTTATLTGSVNAGSTTFTAVYPYSIGNEWCEYSDGKIEWVYIPYEQTATIGSFDPEAAIMIATSGTENKFAFKNVCSFLKITTAEEYKKIVVTTNSGNLASIGTCNTSDAEFSLMDGVGSKLKVTLVPKSGSSTIAKGTYYIAIAPGTLGNLTVDCYTSDSEYAEKSTSSEFTVVRSKSYSLGSTAGWTKRKAGAYSVSATKQVMFTQGNLYWDASESSYHMESSQIGSSRDADGKAIIDDSHVSYFYWTNLADYNSGNAAYMPYASQYSYSSQSKEDKFWCGEDNKITVDGTSNLYVLSNDEWTYLIQSRANASKLHKLGVTVTDGGKTYENCLIIAPDDYDFTEEEIQPSYSLKDINEKGLTCLPAVGNTYDRNNKRNFLQTIWGCYWSSTPSDDYTDNSYDFYFEPYDVSARTGVSIEYRKYAHCIRLVYTY